VIRIDHRISGGDLPLRIIEKPDRVVMQRTQVDLQRQHIVTAVLDDLLCYVALTVEDVDVTIVPLSESISSSFGAAAISLDIVSMMITDSTRPSEASEK
jgi:hypothetical protein